MNRIRLLSEQIANQIAAGEVVERPASVVKELVENALDAEATRITVEIQAGGRSLIRVTDDGFGMSKDDALLCLERHATSKIRRAEDLSSIATMGFRGEALPSIASVSRFILTTRERVEIQTVEGTQIVINGGKILEVKAAGSASGTSVEVRQLFFNLPARRKFLRSEETEFAHIHHYLTLAALGYPNVGFTFLRDTRLVWQLPGIKIDPQNPETKLSALRERMRALLGAEIKLAPVNFSSELPSPENNEEEFENSTLNTQNSKLNIWGFIGAPGVSRSTREDQYLFVNRRPIENRGLNFALLEGYHTALMKGRYPVCCLFLEIDPAEVDVNIHPTKREIKFHRERLVRQLTTQAVRETLLNFHAPPEKLKPVLSAPPIESAPLTLEKMASIETEPAPKDLPDFPKLSKPVFNWPDPKPVAEVAFPQPKTPYQEFKIPSTDPVPLLRVPLRVVGVVGKLYVVLESDRGLVLLDQHAAHERILFEQMMRRLEENGSAASQRLLLPETVELFARDAEFLRRQLPILTRLGVGLNEFGERTFLLDALPPFVKASEPRRFILELVDELKAAGQSVNALRLGERSVVKTVCRHSVKANDPLTGAELENLVNDLRHCSMPYTCPHGRPTLIEMNYRELEKKFGRAQ
ncbi:MAG: DNA mismatch repair endonuclease MutL [Verrucomicrobiota bacterium]|nr:DNA mismatch repair endonuclease MutL [Verrucomicrobiota bacterium]